MQGFLFVSIISSGSLIVFLSKTSILFTEQGKWVILFHTWDDFVSHSLALSQDRVFCHRLKFREDSKYRSSWTLWHGFCFYHVRKRRTVQKTTCEMFRIWRVVNPRTESDNDFKVENYISHDIVDAFNVNAGNIRSGQRRDQI